jgi:hypothetical protein
MSTTSNKFKLGRDSLTYLAVKYPNQTDAYKRYSMDHKTPNNPQRGVSRLERVFLQQKNFEWAVLYDNKTRKIIAYYHPTTGTEQLDKEKYYKALGKASIKLYLIYNSAYKLRTGRTKGLSMPIESLEDVAQYWNQDIERIMVYQNGKHTHNFIKGQFFTV